MSKKIYLSVYHRGQVNGWDRFFDETCSEVLFKFLDTKIQEKLISESTIPLTTNSIVYYSYTVCGNYFFSIKWEDYQCLILSSY